MKISKQARQRVMEQLHHLSAMEIMAVQGLLALKNDESFLFSSSSYTKNKDIVADDITDIKGILFEKMINNVPRKRRGSNRHVSSSSNNKANNVVEEPTSSLGKMKNTESEKCKEEKKTVVGVSVVTSSEQLAAAEFDHKTTVKEEVSNKRKRYPRQDEYDDQLAARIPKKKKTTSSLLVTPPIPQALEDMIRSELGGVDVKLVIQKELFATDLNHNHGRLSMPLLQIRDHDFLTPRETHNLNNPDKRTNPLATMKNLLFIDTKLQRKTITLKTWDMSSSSNYVLMTTWNDIVEDNKLKDQKGKVIQIWSFRMANQLCFAMVILQ